MITTSDSVSPPPQVQNVGRLSKSFPPGPKGAWLLGNLAEYRRGKLGLLERIRKEFGRLATFRLGSRHVVLVSEPQLIKEALVDRNKELGKTYSTRILGEFFGDGLLNSEGENWLQDRRAIQPTFAMQQVKAFGECMVRQTLDYLETWHPGEPRDALVDMQTLTMSIAAETLLGVKLEHEVKAIHRPHTEIREYFDRKLEGRWLLPRSVPTPYNRKIELAKRTIFDLVDALIHKRRQAQTFGPDILSRLMLAQAHSEKPLTDVQLRSQALTFLFAGHETTASLLGWVWYLLAQHPAVEARLHEELDTVLGGRTPTVEDVPQLVVTDQIIQETLRLYPSVFLMSRELLTPGEWMGYSLPKGTNLAFSQWLMHRDADYFEQPLEFRPERWTAEFKRQLPPFAFFPFGGGPRVCIGNTFSVMEAVLVVATIASRYRLPLLSDTPVVPHPSVTLRPSPGVLVSCQPR